MIGEAIAAVKVGRRVSFRTPDTVRHALVALVNGHPLAPLRFKISRGAGWTRNRTVVNRTDVGFAVREVADDAGASLAGLGGDVVGGGTRWKVAT